LEILKSLSILSKNIEKKLTDGVVPLTCNFCKLSNEYNIQTRPIHKDLHYYGERLRNLHEDIEQDFMNKDVFSESVILDKNLESEKRRLRREQDANFMDFYKLKQSRGKLSQRGDAGKLIEKEFSP